MGLPEVRNPDGTEAGILGGVLRKGLDLYANIRPIRLFPEVSSALAGKRAGDIDYVIVRENTEGAYFSRGRGEVDRRRARHHFHHPCWNRADRTLVRLNWRVNVRCRRITSSVSLVSTRVMYCAASFCFGKFFLRLANSIRILRKTVSMPTLPRRRWCSGPSGFRDRL